MCLSKPALPIVRAFIRVQWYNTVRILADCSPDIVKLRLKDRLKLNDRCAMW